MTLKNIQYDTIMREYDRRRQQNRQIQEEHRAHAYRLVPRLKEIQDTIAASSARKVHELLGSHGHRDVSDGKSPSPYLKELKALSRERADLLSRNGLPSDYLEMPCQCPICRDTGYTEEGKCICFQKLVSDLFCQQYGLDSILEKENFGLFSFSFYSDKITDKSTGKTPREHARIAVEKAWAFIQQFQEAPPGLFIYGDTGVGKTFLTHCIACEILKKTYSVLYFPAYDLFSLLASETFGQGSEREGFLEDILECDLLILDDLGTELTNSFVSSRLFQIINERIWRKKPTIISTNLAIETFPELYSTRTFSRIIQNYKFINLIGEDIRIMRRT